MWHTILSFFKKGGIVFLSLQLVLLPMAEARAGGFSDEEKPGSEAAEEPEELEPGDTPSAADDPGWNKALMDGRYTADGIREVIGTTLGIDVLEDISESLLDAVYLTIAYLRGETNACLSCKKLPKGGPGKIYLTGTKTYRSFHPVTQEEVIRVEDLELLPWAWDACKLILTNGQTHHPRWLSEGKTYTGAYSYRESNYYSSSIQPSVSVADQVTYTPGSLRFNFMTREESQLPPMNRPINWIPSLSTFYCDDPLTQAQVGLHTTETDAAGNPLPVSLFDLYRMATGTFNDEGIQRALPVSPSKKGFSMCQPIHVLDWVSPTDEQKEISVNRIGLTGGTTFTSEVNRGGCSVGGRIYHKFDRLGGHNPPWNHELCIDCATFTATSCNFELSLQGHGYVYDQIAIDQHTGNYMPPIYKEPTVHTQEMKVEGICAAPFTGISGLPTETMTRLYGFSEPAWQPSLPFSGKTWTADFQELVAPDQYEEFELNFKEWIVPAAVTGEEMAPPVSLEEILKRDELDPVQEDFWETVAHFKEIEEAIDRLQAEVGEQLVKATELITFVHAGSKDTVYTAFKDPLHLMSSIRQALLVEKKWKPNIMNLAMKVESIFKEGLKKDVFERLLVQYSCAPQEELLDLYNLIYQIHLPAIRLWTYLDPDGPLEELDRILSQVDSQIEQKMAERDLEMLMPHLTDYAIWLKHHQPGVKGLFLAAEIELGKVAKRFGHVIVETGKELVKAKYSSDRDKMGIALFDYILRPYSIKSTQIDVLLETYPNLLAGERRLMEVFLVYPTKTPEELTETEKLRVAHEWGDESDDIIRHNFRSHLEALTANHNRTVDRARQLINALYDADIAAAEATYIIAKALFVEAALTAGFMGAPVIIASLSRLSAALLRASRYAAWVSRVKGGLRYATVPAEFAKIAELGVDFVRLTQSGFLKVSGEFIRIGARFLHGAQLVASVVALPLLAVAIPGIAKAFDDAVNNPNYSAEKKVELFATNLISLSGFGIGAAVGGVRLVRRTRTIWRATEARRVLPLPPGGKQGLSICSETARPVGGAFDRRKAGGGSKTTIKLSRRVSPAALSGRTSEEWRHMNWANPGEESILSAFASKEGDPFFSVRAGETPLRLERQVLTDGALKVLTEVTRLNSAAEVLVLSSPMRLRNTRFNFTMARTIGSASKTGKVERFLQDFQNDLMGTHENLGNPLEIDPTKGGSVFTLFHNHPDHNKMLAFRNVWKKEGDKPAGIAALKNLHGRLRSRERVLEFLESFAPNDPSVRNLRASHNTATEALTKGDIDTAFMEVVGQTAPSPSDLMKSVEVAQGLPAGVSLRIKIGADHPTAREFELTFSADPNVLDLLGGRLGLRPRGRLSAEAREINRRFEDIIETLSTRQSGGEKITNPELNATAEQFGNSIRTEELSPQAEFWGAREGGGE